MDNIQGNIHTTIDDSAIARCYGAIKNVDNNLIAFRKASFVNKPQEAERYAEATRQALMHIVLALHGLKNDVQRLQGEKVQPCTLP